MSRTYRLKVSETYQNHIKVEDGVQTRLSLLGILSRERTAELLEAELTSRGFTRQGSVLIRKDQQGIEVSIDPLTDTVLVRLRQEQDLQLQQQLERSVIAENRKDATERLQQEAQRSLQEQAQQIESQLRQQITERLEGSLRDLQQELAQVSHRVTAEALKERAAQLGQIVEISEEPEVGSLKIRVTI